MAVEKTLPWGQFDNVIRWIKRSEIDRLRQLDVALNATAARLKVRSRAKLAIVGCPAGSDQFDSGSVKEWLDRIVSADTGAVAQVAVLYSTLQVRLNG